MLFQTGVSTFFLPIETQIALAKRNGFEGIELLITQKNQHKMYRMCQKVVESGLQVSLHQSWSLAENPTHFHNKVFDWCGILPPAGYLLEDLFKCIPFCPVTLYADRIQEKWDHPRKRFQTCCVFNSTLEYKLPYREFVKEVTARKSKITFDTQHVLEYRENLIGVEKLKYHSQWELLNILKTAWVELGGVNQIEEIHWNDCNPALGHTKGRNVFPGTGVLPLKAFAEYIFQQGWKGIIVPEVGPGTLILKGKELRDTTAKFFL